MRFFFAVLTEAIQIFFSSVHLAGVSVSLQYPLSMRIHDYRFPESASFKRKEQEVREEGRGKREKEKYQSPQKGNWYFWWGKMDSNHRRHCQQIYSLSPLATREFPHMQFVRRWSW